MDARSLQKLENRLKLLSIPPFKFFLLSRNQQKKILRMVPKKSVFKYCDRRKEFITHDHQYIGPLPKRQSDPIESLGKSLPSPKIQAKKIASAKVKRLRKAERNKINYRCTEFGRRIGGLHV